ncbi:MAG: hypothetical protein ACOCYV_02335 [Planctomycetota bacterium]
MEVGRRGEGREAERPSAWRYGHSHAFIGNADTRVLLGGDRAAIRAEVERCMAIGGDCPGFIMAVGGLDPGPEAHACATEPMSADRRTRRREAVPTALVPGLRRCAGA